MPNSLFNLGRYIQKPKSVDLQQPIADTSGQVASDDLFAPTAPVDPQTPLSMPSQSFDGDIAPSPTIPQQSIHPEMRPYSDNPALKQSQIPENAKMDTFQKRAGMDILSRLTQRSNKSLVAGVMKAKEMQNQFVDTEFVLWGLLQDSGVYQLLSDLKITPTELLKTTETKFKKGNFTGAPKFSPRVKKVLELSFSEARAQGYEFISPEHVLIGLLKEGEGLAAQLLTQVGLTTAVLSKKITGKKEQEEKEEKVASSEFTTDLTKLAREGKLDPVVARSKEIERVMHILSRRTKNNPVLIGEAGVGKTAIVEGLAQRIVAGNVPEPLLNKKIYSLDLTGLLAGASHRGEFEKRFKSLIDEVKRSQGQIILFIDELHNLVGAGGEGGSMDASNILKPSLARGEIQTIGTTTVTEYRKYIEKDRALERRFQPVLVNEPTPEETIEMLMALKDKYEAFHKVSISDETVRSAVRLSSRYIGDRFLPDKAIDLIDEAASSVRLPAISLPEEILSLENRLKRATAEKEEAHKLSNTVKERVIDREIAKLTEEITQKKKDYEIKKGSTTTQLTPEIIQEIVARWTGIPIARLTESESEKLVRLEDILHKKIIDQEEAVAAVSEAVRRGRSGLSSQKRPIGSFIFMGPTGVGKTELAKVLAQELFGSDDMMIRLDMTEYMEKHEVAKLIGAPPGYVGYEEGGQLTEAVRRKPYSVVLMDEIEKAHPDVFNILLQILDDGRLTDNKGRTISFKNTILICTSNLGTNLIQSTMLSQMNVGQIQFSKHDEQISTYTVTPTGRVIVTKGSDYWVKESRVQNQQTEIWTKHSIAEYFQGQKLKGTDMLLPQQKFPFDEFDTHVVYPSGEEMITRGDRLWRRLSTVAKEWESISLIDFLSGHTVINATPDKPDEQLPTVKWDTHAITPGEQEIISLGNRLWIRQSKLDTSWKTILFPDYIKEQSPAVSQVNTVSPLPIEPTGQNNSMPVGKELLLLHAFTQTGDELCFIGGNVFVKSMTAGWKKIPLAEYLAGTNSPITESAHEDEDKVGNVDVKFSELSEKLLEELRKSFRPELLNRFDEIIVFKPLTADHMLAIIELQLAGLHKMLEEQNLALEVSNKAKEELCIVGFDPVFGARPLRRSIQRLVENPISTMIIQGNVKDGDTIVVDYDSSSNEFVFNVRRIAPSSNASLTPQNISQETGNMNTNDTNKVEANQTQTNSNLSTQPETQKPTESLPIDQKTINEAAALSAAIDTTAPSISGNPPSTPQNPVGPQQLQPSPIK